jgi:putative membrane protein
MTARTIQLTRLITTVPSRRRVKIAVLAGLIAGLLGGFVKLGWEVVFPPRVASRTEEPAILLKDLGIHFHHLTYPFSGMSINWSVFIIHFGFSVIFGIFYAVIAEYNPRIKLWYGAAFGVIVWVVFHLLVMPWIGLSPATWKLPFDEDISELFGHIVWLMSIEVVRRDLRSRITHQPDAEFAPVPAQVSTSLPWFGPTRHDKAA